MNYTTVYPWIFSDEVLLFEMSTVQYFAVVSVILLPLFAASLMHKNHQRHKIIHEIHPVGRKE